MICQEHLFRTKVEVPKWDIPMSVSDHVVFLGSCFAQYIGERFQSYGLHSICNPLGVLYNPESIRLQVHAALHIEQDDIPVFKAEKEWRSWLAGTLISGKSEQECRTVVEGALQMLRLSLLSADYLFLTLGTSVCYRLQTNGAVVTNCHKRPHSWFREDWLKLPACVDALSSMIEDLFLENPKLKIVFTISPFRYTKYGFHGNQVAKSTLILAVEEVMKRYPRQVSYFPAYEIVLDELRDYRFYAEDMLHPSSQAVTYIWERFTDVYLSDEAKAFLKEWQPLKAALNHKPFDRESQEYRLFMDKTMLKIAALQKKYPNFVI